MGDLGFRVRFVALDTDETISDNIATADRAEAIAQKKAEAYPTEQLASHQILITADTLVVSDNVVLGKPHTRDEAIAMLQSLSGKSHMVYTGCCLQHRNDRISFTEATKVYFKDLSEEEIEHYVDVHKPFDKAGAYGIQEWIGMIGVTHIEGCYYNVMGLPVSRIYDAIKKMQTNAPNAEKLIAG